MNCDICGATLPDELNAQHKHFLVCPGNARDCRHGALRRSCEICERDAEIAELKAEYKRLNVETALQEVDLKAQLAASEARERDWHKVADARSEEINHQHAHILALDARNAATEKDRDEAHRMLGAAHTAYKRTLQETDEARPYWLWRALLEDAVKGECKRAPDAECPETSDCITSWCLRCAANAFLSEILTAESALAQPAPMTKPGACTYCGGDIYPLHGDGRECSDCGQPAAKEE